MVRLALADAPKVATKAEARAITGGLSAPGKMPGPAWSISARRCHIGGQLQNIPGTVCNNCYALKGRYPFPNVQAAQERRLAALDHPDWVPAMVRDIGAEPYFRWFDSGDLQDERMLSLIVAVVRATPGTRHWLPTRETGIITRWLDKFGPLPDNLTVRVSCNWIDGGIRNLGNLGPGRQLPASVVSTGAREYPEALECPANHRTPRQCLDCRACWDGAVPVIVYPAH